MFIFCSFGISEAQISTKILQAINTLVDAEGNLILPNADYLTIGTTDTTLADFYLYQESSAAKDGILVFKGSDTNKTALKVTHNSTLSTRYIAEFLNSNGTVMKIGANSIVNLGADDLIAHLYINDAGTIVMYDDSNDTSVTIGPVGNGTTSLGITGALDVSTSVTANAGLAAKYGATAGGFLDLFEDSDNGTNKLTIKAIDAITADTVLEAGDAKLRRVSTTDAHTFCLQGYHGDSANYVDALCIENETAASGKVKVTLGANAVLETGDLSAGGIILGDSTPDADGEIGYASNAYKWFANSEDLVLTASADTWTWSSATGVTGVGFGALNLVTTGTISGAIPSTTDNNGQTLSAAQQYGYMHWATGAGTTNLVTAVAGMNFCVYSTTAAAVVINPADADVITLNGTALSAGDSITSASGAGDFICLMSQEAGKWVTLGRSGTWTDTN